MRELADEYKDVNANALLERWDSLALQLRTILKANYKNTTFKTEWSDEIENVLVLLMMMPSKQVGRNVIASEKTFNDSVDKLLQFVKVNVD